MAAFGRPSSMMHYIAVVKGRLFMPNCAMWILASSTHAEHIHVPARLEVFHMFARSAL